MKGVINVHTRIDGDTFCPRASTTGICPRTLVHRCLFNEKFNHEGEGEPPVRGEEGKRKKTHERKREFHISVREVVVLYS
jgi:hypothetical protein